MRAVVWCGVLGLDGVGWGGIGLGAVWCGVVWRGVVGVAWRSCG